MDLSRDAREYVKWPVSGAPDGASLEVQFGDSAWAPAESTSPTQVRVLIAGPDADPGSAVVLPLGLSTVRFRLVDNPEIVVRGGGSIRVK
jgi:hypothetical protein